MMASISLIPRPFPHAPKKMFVFFFGEYREGLGMRLMRCLTVSS